MKKMNQNGFNHVVIIAILVVIGAVGFAGFRVFNNKNESQVTRTDTDTIEEAKNADTSASTTQPKATLVDTTNWTLVAPKNTGFTYGVKVPSSLLPDGTCVGKIVLLGIIFNSDSNDYDCKNVTEALGYASIVFGQTSESVLGQLGKIQSQSKVTLADGKTVATKSVTTQDKMGNGGAYVNRYVVYEAVSTTVEGVFYAVYQTSVGFSDEDKLLKDYELAISNGWYLP